MQADEHSRSEIRSKQRKDSAEAYPRSRVWLNLGFLSRLRGGFVCLLLKLGRGFSPHLGHLTVAALLACWLPLSTCKGLGFSKKAKGKFQVPLEYEALLTSSVGPLLENPGS